MNYDMITLNAGLFYHVCPDLLKLMALFFFFFFFFFLFSFFFFAFNMMALVTSTFKRSNVVAFGPALDIVWVSLSKCVFSWFIFLLFICLECLIFLLILYRINDRVWLIQLSNRFWTSLMITATYIKNHIFFSLKKK